jgi:hypothetical protein
MVKPLSSSSNIQPRRNLAHWRAERARLNAIAARKRMDAALKRTMRRMSSKNKKPKALVEQHCRPETVRCLRCEKVIKSPDKRRIRLCPVCRQRK